MQIIMTNICVYYANNVTHKLAVNVGNFHRSVTKRNGYKIEVFDVVCSSIVKNVFLTILYTSRPHSNNKNTFNYQNKVVSFS